MSDAKELKSRAIPPVQRDDFWKACCKTEADAVPKWEANWKDVVVKKSREGLLRLFLLSQTAGSPNNLIHIPI